MRQIQLTQGKVAVISDWRFDFISQWEWSAIKKPEANTWYAARREKQDGVWKTIYMHKEILKVPDDMEVDHKDGDGLNNIDDNLRASTHVQNMQNRRIHKNNKTSYKGVVKTKSGKFGARLRLNGKRVLDKTFPTAIEAALAYDAKARELFGEFAKTNFQ